MTDDLRRFLPLFFTTVAISSVAIAHPGHGVSGLLHGLQHPFSGLDHLLMAVAVGVWAASAPNKRTWVIPSVFLSALLLGGFLGFRGLALPFQDAGILWSLGLLGCAFVVPIEFETKLAIPFFVISGVFHGNAHATEMLHTVSVGLYGLGFVLATAFLHVSGVFLVRYSKEIFGNLPTRRLVQASGIGIVSCALLIFMKVIPT